MRRSTLLVSLLLGCASTLAPTDGGTPDTGDPVADACGGARPSLDECTVGLFHADCGGIGGPTFACGESGQCRWFSTGCVAVGHHTSDCAAGELCCHVTEDGNWPFADGWTNPIGPFHEDMLADIATLAETLVTPTSPANVVLTLDPSVAAGTRMVTCTGSPMGGAGGLCSRWLVQEVGIVEETFVIVVQPAIHGISLLAEVVVSGSEPVARAFFGYQNDVALRDPPSTCPTFPYPLGPVTSGTLTLSSPTDGAHGVLTVDVEGGTISVSF